jgi:DNA-directed RNA polymerase specialized sigma24 family protein
MPDDVALAAAVVDSLVWDIPHWVADVASWQAAEPPVIAPSGYDRLLVEHGWHDAQDVLDAAHVSAQQGQVLRLVALGWDHRSIGKELGISAGASRLQAYRATEKLHSLVDVTLARSKCEG